MEVHCCCLHVNYIVYKHFDRSLHVRSLEPTCVQNFRPVPLTVFEIQGVKLKLNNDKEEENWRNGLFAVSPMFVIQFSLNDIFVNSNIQPQLINMYFAIAIAKITKYGI